MKKLLLVILLAGAIAPSLEAITLKPTMAKLYSRINSTKNRRLANQLLHIAGGSLLTALGLTVLIKSPPIIQKLSKETDKLDALRTQLQERASDVKTVKDYVEWFNGYVITQKGLNAAQWLIRRWKQYQQQPEDVASYVDGGKILDILDKGEQKLEKHVRGIQKDNTKLKQYKAIIESYYQPFGLGLCAIGFMNIYDGLSGLIKDYFES